MKTVFYISKYDKLTGTSYRELLKKAETIAGSLHKNPRRKSFVRSKYFNDDKIFLENFWTHLCNKPPADRRRRIVYFQCAIELIQNSKCEPDLARNPHRTSDIWYTFYGQTKAGEKFAIHIKKNSRDNKYLMSIFPLQ